MRPTLALTILLLMAATTFAQPEDQWFRFYGGESGLHSINEYDKLPDGEYVCIGTTSHFNPPNYLDIAVVKVGRDGDRIWRRIFRQGPQPGSIRRLDDGGYAFTVEEYMTSVIRLDTFGNLVWECEINEDWVSLVDVVETQNGDLLTVGDKWIDSHYEIFVAQISSTGTLIWSHQIPSEYNCYATDIESRPNGGYVVFGSMHPDESDDVNFYMMFLDEAGLEESLYIYPADGTHYLRQGIVLENGYLLVGHDDYPESQGEAIRTDLNGAVLWESAYTGGVRLDGVTAMVDGGFAFCGYNEVQQWEKHSWILKANADGDIEWELFREDEDYYWLKRISADDTGVLYGFGAAAPEGMMWILGRPEPEPAPQVTIVPLNDYPIRMPADGGNIRYFLDLKNDRDVLLDVQIRRRAFTPGETHVSLSDGPNLTLPPNSQQTFENLYQPVPGWAPPGNYAFIVELLDAETDSVIAEDSVVLRKFE